MKINPVIKQQLKDACRQFIWQLGYDPLVAPKPETFIKSLKRTIRTRPGRDLEAEIENIMFELRLFNNSGEYAMHLNTERLGENHFRTFWKIPRGLNYKAYQDKSQTFADNLTGQVIIEQRNGCLMIEIIKGIIPNNIWYSFNYQDYPDMILPIPVGHDQGGLVVWDLAKIPHVVVAGTTGTGKSILLSGVVDALAQNPLARLCVADLAMTDFGYVASKAIFAGEFDQVEALILALEAEMHKRRYILAKDTANRNIIRYNKKHTDNPLPYYVLIVDEFAFTSPKFAKKKWDKDRCKELHATVAGISMLARKVGIHLVIGLQRPEVELLPESIKSQFPGRISLRTEDVPTSMTILQNSDAFYLPNIKGRAIAKLGNIQREVQVMNLEPDIAEKRFMKFSVPKAKFEGGYDIYHAERQIERLPPR